MSECTLSSWPCHRRCCTVPRQAESFHRNIIVNPSSGCSGCLLAHPSYGISPLLTRRCLCCSYCPFLLDAKCSAGQNLERSLAVGSLVLAKKESNCYYYQGTIIKDLEEGEQRSFLVQFAMGQDTPYLQKTASSDILECLNGMRHSILPGDKVMAPWEPEQKRYGPGTVFQGMETRDPLREKEDEQITVSFWNGKKAKVPLGLAVWISPARWERIVERIHMPYTSRKQFEGTLHRPGYYNCSHGTIPTCALGDFQRCWCTHCCFTHPSCTDFHHACLLPRHRQCVSCCCHCYSEYSGWWTRPSLAALTSGDLKKEFISKPTTPFLAIEAEQAAVLSSSSSSSSESQCERDKSSTENTMVDRAVNTDSSLFENLTLQETRRPEWKYWKRSQPTFVYKSQAASDPLATFGRSSIEPSSADKSKLIFIALGKGSQSQTIGANIVSSSCRKERADNKAISSADGFPPILYNHSAIFETIEQSRQRHLSMKKILSHGITSSSWGG